MPRVRLCDVSPVANALLLCSLPQVRPKDGLVGLVRKVGMPTPDSRQDLHEVIVALVVVAILLGAIAGWMRLSRRGRAEEEDLWAMPESAPGFATGGKWSIVPTAGGNPAGLVQFAAAPQARPNGAPPIRQGALAPHAAFGPCSNCHKILPWPQPPPALAVNAAMPHARLPMQEGHWQGMEVIGITPGLAREYGLLAQTRGVLVDDVTLAAADAGLWAGDLLVDIEGMPTLDLPGFLAATRRVAARTNAKFQVVRGGRTLGLELTAPEGLGAAQMEGAPMITAGSPSPHRYQGACTNCHTIGTTGQLAFDQGDMLSFKAPPIWRGAKAPHRYRGECSTCHKVR